MKSMIKLLLVTAMSFAMVFVAQSKGKDKKESNNNIVQGQVIDRSTGETLAGVIVKIQGTDIQTTTDLDGNFIIKDVNPGDYKLCASYISYKDDVVEIKVAGKSDKIIVQLTSR